MDTDHDHQHGDLDRGIGFDVSTLLERRRALKLMAGAGVAAVLAACGSGSKSTSAASSSASSATTSTSATSSTSGSSTSAASSAAASLSPVPEETAGPYPGDGSNGPNVLNESGIVRSDIRSSFGSSSTVADGVPLTVELKIVDSTTGAAKSGAAVYLWHCDIAGRYSLYTQGVTNENYLRGVQEADGNGELSFTSIFPAAYSGRWPHIHFEVYPSLAEATKAGSPTVTSQLALPKDTCDVVYATDGYSQSIRNLAQTSLARDMVFSDGAELETPTVTGDVRSGFVASLTVGV
jgi:protocatechuate 3,4-dioxygenase beta subunit